MELDQHRGQVTAEWVDTETGEVSRARWRRRVAAGSRTLPAASTHWTAL
jgi:hypothetical protein